MPVTNVKTANFGKSKSGLLGSVGYTLYLSDGTISQPRTTIGVYELGASGIYATEITFDDTFHGTIFWDCDDNGTMLYASEEYNATTSATVILEPMSEDVTFIKNIEGGRWIIDRQTKQMIFYDESNTEEIARFNLLDGRGNPSFASVFERIRV